MAGLSNKRRVFVEEYIRCGWNATEAARRAGYKQPLVQGPRLLGNVRVREAIQARLAEIKMGADEVLVRLAEQARAEYGAYLCKDGTVDLERMLADGKAHLIKGTKWDRLGNLVVEFYDAHAALVDLGKHLGLFTERVDVTSGGQPLKGYVTVSPDDWDDDGSAQSD